MIRNKTIKFNMDKQGDRELWNLLQSLAHGEFSEGTKKYWRNLFKIIEEENSPEAIKMKEFREKLLLIEHPWIAEMKKGEKGE